MKVLIISGNIRKKSQTIAYIEEVEKCLKSYPGMEVEMVQLREVNLQTCYGCTLCIEKGETKCPRKDDYLALMGKIEAADGLIFATPNYAMQITWLMKNFFDRSAYLMHRPSWFGKLVTSFVTQASYGASGMHKYIKNATEMMGANYKKGLTISVSDCNAIIKEGFEHEKMSYDNDIEKFVKSYYKALIKNPWRRPSFFRFIIFRFSRNSHKKGKRMNEDYYYFKDKGWFLSDYYYPVRISLILKVFGKIIDRIS